MTLGDADYEVCFNVQNRTQSLPHVKSSPPSRLKPPTRPKYNANPDQFAAQAYTAVYLFAEAAKHASLGFSDIAKDRDVLKAALEKVSLDTPLGRFSFTSAHDVHQPIYVVAMDGSGGFTLVDTLQP